MNYTACAIVFFTLTIIMLDIEYDNPKQDMVAVIGVLSLIASVVFTTLAVISYGHN